MGKNKANSKHVLSVAERANFEIPASAGGQVLFAGQAAFLGGQEHQTVRVPAIEHADRSVAQKLRAGLPESGCTTIPDGKSRAW